MLKFSEVAARQKCWQPFRQQMGQNKYHGSTGDSRREPHEFDVNWFHIDLRVDASGTYVFNPYPKRSNVDKIANDENRTHVTSLEGCGAIDITLVISNNYNICNLRLHQTLQSIFTNTFTAIYIEISK
jgi:hypothetical protein